MGVCNLKEGMTVAEDCVFLGQLLVKKGTRLTTQDIIKLKAFGIDSVNYVIDETSVKVEVEQHLKNGLSSLSNYGTKSYYSIEDVITEVVESVSSDPFIIKELFALKRHSEVTFKHSLNTAVCSLILGSHLDFDLDDIYALTQGALLHDIGKVYAPSGILEKSGKLTGPEYQIIIGHPEHGYRLLLSNGIQEQVARVCLEHHENFDGSGYPNRLVGNDVSLFSRIVHVADVFDALCSQRSYKLAHLPSQGLDYLRKHQGHFFDLEIVQSAIANFQSLAICYQR